MNKRVFLQALGATAALWPLAARPQATKRISVLTPLAQDDTEAQRELRAFRGRLGELGWTDGKNLRLDYRWTGGDFARLPTTVSELLAQKPEVIVARSTPVTAALVKQTRAIPIVFVVVSDPVGDGLVTNLGREAMSRVSRTSNLLSAASGSSFSRKCDPGLSRTAVLFNPQTAPGGGGASHMRSIEEVAAPIGVKIAPMHAADAPAIERAIESLASQPNAALLVMPDATNVQHRKLIVATVARHRVLAVYPTSAFAAEGALATMASTCQTSTGAARTTWTGYCAARSPASCQFRRRSSSS